VSFAFYQDSIRSYFTRVCFENLFLHLSLCLCVVARLSTFNTQYAVWLCFPGMTPSLVKSKQIIGAHFQTFFLQYSYFGTFLNIHIYIIILKTYDQQFTFTTKKSLHIVFKAGFQQLVDLVSDLFSAHNVSETRSQTRYQTSQLNTHPKLLMSTCRKPGLRPGGRQHRSNGI